MIRSTGSFALLLLFAGSVFAQSPAGDELPTVQTAQPPAPPASSAAPTKAPDIKNNAGTTIIGERESPIGLYITPWHNAAAETDIDRPARLLSVGLEVLDRRVFARQVEYYEALSAAQKAKTGGVPSAPAAP